MVSVLGSKVGKANSRTGHGVGLSFKFQRGAGVLDWATWGRANRA